MPNDLVLLNRHAANGRAARLAPALADWLQAHAPQACLLESTGIEASLAHLHAMPAGSHVVLVGGDGTILRMLPALLARGHELGLVPLGSGNDSARAFGVHGWQ